MIYVSYTAVFNTPKIINSSANEVCATLNDSVKIYCTFNASTIDGATIVVWLKDHTVISGYDNETRPVEDNVILSILNFESFTREDQGEYSCYCYYNQNMVTSDNLVTSDQATVNVHIDCASGKGKPGYIITGYILYNWWISSLTETTIPLKVDYHNQWCCCISSYKCYMCSDIYETKRYG